MHHLSAVQAEQDDNNASVKLVPYLPDMSVPVMMLSLGILDHLNNERKLLSSILAFHRIAVIILAIASLLPLDAFREPRKTRPMTISNDPSHQSREVAYTFRHQVEPTYAECRVKHPQSEPISNDTARK